MLSVILKSEKELAFVTDCSNILIKATGMTFQTIYMISGIIIDDLS